MFGVKKYLIDDSYFLASSAQLQMLDTEQLFTYIFVRNKHYYHYFPIFLDKKYTNYCKPKTKQSFNYNIIMSLTNLVSDFLFFLI